MMAMFSITKLFGKRILSAGKFKKPRKWSNDELKKIGHLFGGSVINVSGKVDADKEGGLYRSYFGNAKEYFVSNYDPDHSTETDSRWDYNINLDEDLDSRFKNRFDVVFNHTTLEHIFDTRKAFKNLCLMSKDIVIIVVPFLQQMHWGASYKDYWRFTPYAIKEMFKEEGMEIVYISGNNKPRQSVYLFAVGSKNPATWNDKFPEQDMEVFENLGDLVI